MTDPHPSEPPGVAEALGPSPATAAWAEAPADWLRLAEDDSATVPIPPEPAAPPAMPGYAVEGVLGRGGMGVVYKATHLALQRPVALKLVLAGAHAGPTELARFAAEARAVARLQHPNIVQVFETGVHDGLPYCALEFLPGGSLRDRLRGQPLPPRAAAALLARVAAAVHAAHRAGIVHRDLKPANVLLDAAGEPKVTDFGLAKRLDAGEGLTRSGSILGTPNYMAPEQAGGDSRHVGPAADIFALGGTLYELLTGRPPFAGVTPVETVLQVVSADPLPPSRLRPGLPRDLETIALKCLAKDPGRRYASAQDLADDLARFGRGEAIRARPAGRAERAWRWGRRHPSAAAALLLGLALAVGGPALALREHDLRAAADQARQEAEGARREAEAARREAEGARAAAAQEAARTKAVNDFLQQDLLQLAAGNAQLAAGIKADPDLKLRTLLDRAADRIGDRFQDQPLAEAQLRATLAAAFMGVGEYAKAAAQYEGLIRLQAAGLGADHLTVLAARGNAAVAYQRAGQYARAAEVQETVLRQLAATLGPDHPETLAAQVNLGLAYRDMRQPARAIPLLEAARRALLAQKGPREYLTLAATNNLALAYQAAGRVGEAIPLFEATLRIHQETLPPDHSVRLSAQANLAGAYHQAGRTAEALPLWEETLARREAVLGPDHPVTYLNLNQFAQANWAIGRYRRAAELFAELVRRQTARLGPDHPDRLHNLLNLAVNYHELGRGTEALAAAEEAYRRRRALPDTPPAAQVPYLDGLAAINGRLNRPAQVAEVLAELLRLQRLTLPADGPKLADLLAELGEWQLRAGRGAEAAASLREGLDLRERAAPDAWTTAATRSLLGQALLAQGQVAEAEPLLRQALAELRAREPTLPPPGRAALTAAVGRVMRWCEAAGKAEEAAALRRDLARRLAAGLTGDLPWPLLWGRPLPRPPADFP